MKNDFHQGSQVISGGTSYRLWAPAVQTMTVEILHGDQVLREIPLERDEEGFHSGVDREGRAGDLYKFRLDRGDQFPDPTSRWQPHGVHGPSMVMAPSSYAWQTTSFRAPALRDLVIYELHVGTFTPEGSFRAAIERLDEVRALGVNALELMPIADFAGGRNWGYDGVSWFAPSRAYGHPDDLRELVDAAHGLGLAVILDVVYNHFGPDGNYFHAYIGEYLDEAAKTPWGGAIRYGDPAFKPFREWVISSPAYWMDEFHFDGFRFDATHAILDPSPRHILQEMTAAIHARGGFAIAEDPRNDAKLVTPEAEGGLGFDAVWADDFHHIVRVANTHEAEGYLGDFQGTLAEAVDVLRHGWLYRGQPTKSTGRPRGGECRQVLPQRFVHCISNHDQTGNHAFGERLSHRILPTALRAAEVLLCLTPYMPLLFMGQEWSASTPFLFFTDHDEELGKLIVKGRREEFKNFAAFQEPAMLEKIPSPQKISTFEASKLIWGERTRERHAGALDLYKTCLGLRAAHAAFRPTERETWQTEEITSGLGALRFHGSDAHWLLLFDLHGGHHGALGHEEILQPAGANWQLVLHSEEERFGGSGKCALDLENWHAHFEGPQAVLLRSEKV